MIKVDIRGLDSVLNGLKNLEKQHAFASAVAMNEAAFQAMREGKAELRSKLDRPTPWTISSWRVRKKAKRGDLTAIIGMSDFLSDKQSRGPSSKLQQHFVGGGRSTKQLEERLRAAGYLGASEYIVPGGAAKLDRYGNMSRGQIQQIMSQIGLKGSGYDSVATKSRRSMRNQARAGHIFWSMGIGSPGSRAYSGKLKFDLSSGKYYGVIQHLPKGAWMRGPGTVKPLMIVVRKPHYRRRLDIDCIAQRVMTRDFPAAYSRALQRALFTARRT